LNTLRAVIKRSGWIIASLGAMIIFDASRDNQPLTISFIMMGAEWIFDGI
jgi:hypothetical protein